MAVSDAEDNFLSRYKYFKEILNPIWLFKSKHELLFAKEIINTTNVPNDSISETDLKWARTLYASAFHPDTKEINPMLGRMSFQIPGNTFVTALMLTFYKTPAQLVVTQWINQSFMAFCNYTNRNAQSSLTNTQITLAYLSATGTAVAASYKLSRLAARSSHPLAAKFVPFAAVCAGNTVNVPLMRQQDFLQGIAVNDAQGQKLGDSKKIGCMCLAQVVATRICAAIPIMVFPPIIMSYLTTALERRTFNLRKSFGRPFAVLLEASLIGACTYLVLPVAVALFPQHSSVGTDFLETSLQKKIKELNPQVNRVYFNKGL